MRTGRGWGVIGVGVLVLGLLGPGAQAQAAHSEYDKAYAVCLEGRGYQVR